MRQPLQKGAALGVALGVLAAVSGCRTSDGAVKVGAAPAPPPPAAGVGRKAAVGATPDMNDYAAPAGVRTGVLPGGQK